MSVLTDLVVPVGGFVFSNALGLAYGYFIGRRMWPAAWIVLAAVWAYGWIPVALDPVLLVSSFHRTASGGPWAWTVVVAQVALWMLLVYIGYRHGTKRRLNPPKPKEAKAPAPLLSAFGRRTP